MDYFILTETEFFGLINGNDTPRDLNTAYNDFVKSVIGLCCGTTAMTDVVIALAYAENELQHHHTFHSVESRNPTDFFARKALAFIRKMQRSVVMHRHNTEVPPLSNLSASETSPKKNPNVSVLRWTGNAIDLVEMIYGIHEMGCVNDGAIPLKQLAPILYSFFGVETKDCYRHYTDIKRRKTVSHTHFLEQMQNRLNERIRRDEEAERKRR